MTIKTPAADALAAQQTDLTADLDRCESDTYNYAIRLTRARLEEAAPRLGVSFKRSDSKAEIADRYAQKAREQHPATKTLADLRYAASTEARIIEFATEADSKQHAASLRQAILDLIDDPKRVSDGATIADYALSYERRRQVAENWEHVRAAMDRGETPVEAVKFVAGHVTRQVVMGAKYGSHSTSATSNLQAEARLSGNAEWLDDYTVQIASER